MSFVKTKFSPIVSGEVISCNIRKNVLHSESSHSNEPVWGLEIILSDGRVIISQDISCHFAEADNLRSQLIGQSISPESFEDILLDFVNF